MKEIVIIGGSKLIRLGSLQRNYATFLLKNNIQIT